MKISAATPKRPSLKELQEEFMRYQERMAESTAVVIRCQSRVRAGIARKVFSGAKKRKNIIGELIDTERRYLAQLRIVVEKFETPLKERSRTRDMCILPGGVVDAIFRNVSEVANGVATLERELCRAVDESSTWVMGPAIGSAFLRSIPALVPHVEYTVGFQEAFEALQQCMRMPTFNAWARATAKSVAELQGLDLADLLILPVQRVPRYIMLAESILARSAAGHPDHAALTTAHACLRRLASYMNERRRKRDTMLQARRDVAGIDDLARDPSRFVVRKGPLMFSSDHKSRHAEFCFLFNDTLVLAKAAPKEKDKEKGTPTLPYSQQRPPQPQPLFRACGRVCFTENMSVEPKTEPKGTVHSFAIVTPAEGEPSPATKQVFGAIGAEERDGWVSDIQEVIKTLGKTLPSFLTIMEREFPGALEKKPEDHPAPAEAPSATTQPTRPPK